MRIDAQNDEPSDSPTTSRPTRSVDDVSEMTVDQFSILMPDLIERAVC